jgi:hypothetical protein
MRLMHDPRLREARFGLCLLGLLSFSLLAGCGGGGGGSNGNSGGGTTTTTGTTTTGTGTTGTGTTGTGTSTGGQPALTATVTTVSGLTASLSEASSTVSVGGTMTYTLTLTNSTAAAIPVHSNGLNIPAAGIIVRGPSGAISYDPVPGPAPVINGSLAPGQTLTTTVIANGFTAAGNYSAIATFSDDFTPGYSASVGPLTVTAQ